MKKILLCLIPLLKLAIVFGQIEATTKDGKAVILNSNGTWKYVEEDKKVVESTITPISYECKDIVIDKVDKMTGESTRMMKEGMVVSEDNENGFGIIAFEASGSVILKIIAAGAGSCIEDAAEMNILFRDGTRLKMVNGGKFNCEGVFTVYFGGGFGKRKELEILRSKEIETLRVWTSKSYVEKDFSSENSKMLMASLSCLNVK
ncbi:hypothetical protein ACFQ21_08945 [Ohtaekwangia kribbensis]|uniref:DUF4923 domain-containing protein n=1 Tax=Ohtaekwangia kribbensis TaxID=688913 RepID=A0ABW3K343_9BACT